MQAYEAKEISDKINANAIDYASDELDHVHINIQDAAKGGLYNVDYAVVKRNEFAVANALKEELIKEGYQVLIENGDFHGTKCNTLRIDWSNASDN